MPVCRATGMGQDFDDWNTWILIYNYGYPEEFDTSRRNPERCSERTRQR